MYYNFTPRQKTIIHYLSLHSTSVSGKQLAIATGVTERSVRNDVREIAEIIAQEDLSGSFQLVSRHARGYAFVIQDQPAFNQFLRDIDYSANLVEKELISFREREVRLLAILVNGLTLYQLSQIMYFSEPTIRSLIRSSNDLSREKNHFVIVIRKGKLETRGKELAIRFSALKTIFMNPYFKDFPENVKALLTDATFEANVTKLLTEVFCRHQELSIAGDSFGYLAKLLWICCRRDQFGYSLTFSTQEAALLQRYDIEEQIAGEFLDGLQEQYHYEFNEGDRIYLTLILAANGDRQTVNREQLDTKSREICNWVEDTILRDFCITSPDAQQSLHDNLSLLFWSFIVRQRFEISRLYLGATRVKRKLITACEYSRYLLDRIENRYGIHATDKEPVLMTMFIADSIAESGGERKKKVLVTGKYGIVESRRYAAMLRRNFGPYLETVAACDPYRLEGLRPDYDLVFTNDRQAAEAMGDQFYFSSSTLASLTPSQRRLLTGRHDEIWLYERLSPDRFITNLSCGDKTDVFSYIDMVLCRGINKEYYWRMVHQEKQISCECGYRNALVSLVDENFQKSELYFLVLKNAIQWNTRFVQNVIVLKARNYRELADYDYGLQKLTTDPYKSSLLIGEPGMATIKKSWKSPSETQL